MALNSVYSAFFWVLGGSLLALAAYQAPGSTHGKPAAHAPDKDSITSTTPQSKMPRGRKSAFSAYRAAPTGRSAAGSRTAETADAPTPATLTNPAAYIPPQCYTQLERQGAESRNPCAVCHTQGLAPNFIDDSDLQTQYSFPDYALANHWENLFLDRRAAVARISDADMLQYVRTDNYQDESGHIRLAAALETPPAAWDSDRDGHWDGFTPDCYFRFDAAGFDHAPDGRITGWRTFDYAPFPGVSLPGQGSMGDAMIRLPTLYQQGNDGAPDLNIYQLNLAIVEAVIKRANVPIDPVEELTLGVDLDRDGKLARASHIAYAWAPRQGVNMSFVGAARGAVQRGEAPPPTAGLYPPGSEFLHSVRYLDVTESGEVIMSQRMKELRYAKKARALTYAQLTLRAHKETKEKRDGPDRLREVLGDLEHGVSTGNGWILQGFIEDVTGSLRPQTFEEQLFCVGCHSGIGATTDATFAFPRKVAASAPAHGWTHTAQHDSPQAQLALATAGSDIVNYLRQNHSVNPFGEDAAVDAQLFDGQGQLTVSSVRKLTTSLTSLKPSASKALALDKAYRLIVQEQSYIKGRDATLEPPAFVHRQL